MRQKESVPVSLSRSQQLSISARPTGKPSRWAANSLIYTTSNNPSPEVLNGLEELAKLASQRCPSFPQPIPDYRPELEAALWWRLGEAFRSQDDTKALEWYEKALTRLSQLAELREKAASAASDAAYKRYEEKKYAECIDLLNRAIELKSNYAWAYFTRGRAYSGLEEYQRAIADYSRAIELDPKDATAYSNRGLCYLWLGNIQQARDDYSRSCEL